MNLCTGSVKCPIKKIKIFIANSLFFKDLSDDMITEDEGLRLL